MICWHHGTSEETTFFYYYFNCNTYDKNCSKESAVKLGSKDSMFLFNKCIFKICININIFFWGGAIIKLGFGVELTFVTSHIAPGAPTAERWWS